MILIDIVILVLSYIPILKSRTSLCVVMIINIVMTGIFVIGGGIIVWLIVLFDGFGMDGSVANTIPFAIVAACMVMVFCLLHSLAAIISYKRMNKIDNMEE